MKVKVPFITPTKGTVVIKTNTKGESPKYFGASVPSLLRTKCQFFLNQFLLESSYL
jgi:hypothetical protein